MLANFPSLYSYSKLISWFSITFWKIYGSFKKKFSSEISQANAESLLEQIQKELDLKVLDLYGLVGKG